MSLFPRCIGSGLNSYSQIRVYQPMKDGPLLAIMHEPLSNVLNVT